MKLIPLTKGVFAIIDDEDFDRVNQFKWQAECRGEKMKRWVVSRMIYENGTHRTIKLHRFILNAPKGMHVDHKNHNGLDNRKENLRLCTAIQNHQNRRKSRGVSQYKGVVYIASSGRWRAYLKIDRKPQHLGCFLTEREAAEAYNEGAKRLFGEFAFLNSI